MKEEITNAVTALATGGCVAFPSEIGWLVGCDSASTSAVTDLLSKAKRINAVPMGCMMANDAMLEKHIKPLPEVAYDILDFSTKPTLIVYDGIIGIAPELETLHPKLAVLVTKNQFCSRMISSLKSPVLFFLVSQNQDKKLKILKEIDPAILKDMAYVVNLQTEVDAPNNYAIIQLNNSGLVKVLRE